MWLGRRAFAFRIGFLWPGRSCELVATDNIADIQHIDKPLRLYVYSADLE